MSDINKLSFLSGQLDAKKSELSSLFGKKKAEPIKEEPKKEEPKKEEPKKEEPKKVNELGAYDAYVRVFDDFSVKPMSLTETIGFVRKLEGMSQAEKIAYIQKACDSAKEDFDAESEEELFAVYHGLETSLYIADDNETIQRLAGLMYEVRNKIPYDGHFACGDFGVAVVCVNSYRENDFDGSSKQAGEIWPAGLKLMRYCDAIMEKIDSVRVFLRKQTYAELSDYYERLSIMLGECMQGFGLCIQGTSNARIYAASMAEEMIKDSCSNFDFYNELQDGCKDWKRECIAHAYAKHLRGCGGNDAIDAAEMVLLADVKNLHYAKRSSQKFENDLRSIGGLKQHENETMGIFAGELGKKLRTVEGKLEPMGERPDTKWCARGAVAILMCLVFLVFMWSADPFSAEWLGGISIKQMLIFVAISAVIGAVAKGKSMLGSALGVSAVVYLAGIFLERILGMDQFIHSRVFMTIAMAICVYRFLKEMSQNTKKKLNAYVESERKRKAETVPELEFMEGYAKTLLSVAEKIGSEPLAVYYTAVLTHIDVQKAKI